LNNTETHELEELITEYKWNMSRLTECTGAAQPIQQLLRRLPLAKHAEMGKMLEDMKQHEVNEEPLVYSCCSSMEEKWGTLFLHGL
jgi:hypothetical protein